MNNQFNSVKINNPFNSVNLTELIERQLVCFEIDQPMPLETDKKPLYGSVRSTIQSIERKHNIKFKCKTAKDGKVWVKRIA